MPIFDTVLLFAAADRSDPNHNKATRYMTKLRQEDFYLASFSLIEFDIVLKSRGLKANERMDLHALLMKDYPNLKIHPINPSTLYLTAMIEKDYDLEYFDAAVSAEALQHDATVVSTDKALERVKGLNRTW